MSHAMNAFPAKCIFKIYSFYKDEDYGIHNTGGNLRHDKLLHTLRGRTKQSKTGGWSKNSTREKHEIVWKAVDAYI